MIYFIIIYTMDIEKLISDTVKTNWKPILLSIVQDHKDFINTELTNRYEFFGEENIFPNKNLIFNCFNQFDIEDLKCIIIGQDCYHTRGVANGLCFSQNTEKPQPSLNNIFKELHRCFGITRTNTDLTDWAKQGCLLLNMSLTVLENKPNSHAKIWNNFTDDIMKYIANNFSGITIMLWGNYAMCVEKHFVNNKNKILKAGHPSPLNTKKPFVGCNHFLEVTSITWI